MTRTEVENSLEMRIVFREMVKKYPFILDIKMSDEFEQDNLNFDYVYFSKITVSNSKIMEQYPYWGIRSWMRDRFEESGEIINLIYLSEFYESDYHPKPSDVQKEMDEEMYKIHQMIRKQVTIPDNFKLKKVIATSKFTVVE